MINRGRIDTTAVSLFPFLAVLICTMGVLIVLLVLAVKAADHPDGSQSDVLQRSAEKAIALEAALLDETLRIDGLLGLRPDLQHRLSQARDERGYLENEIRQLQNELRVMRQSNARSEQKISAHLSIKELDVEIKNVESQISELKTKTDALRTTRDNNQTRFSIVPYKGNSGTARRPIYIECTKQGLFIQPGAIQLTERDFTFPVLPGNPLDACLLAIRQYQRRNQLESDSGQAYPLLVIRPGGESYFALARRGMKSWDDEFGYELVESDKTLDFGAVDPALIAELNRVIDESLRKQERLVAVMESRGQVFQSPGINRERGDNGRPGQNSSSASADEGWVSGRSQSTGSDFNEAVFGNDQQDRSQGNRSDRDSGIAFDQSFIDQHFATSQFEKDGTKSKSPHSENLVSSSGGRGAEGELDSRMQSSSVAGDTLQLNIGQPPNPSASQSNATAQEPHRSHRGDQWALPASTANAIAYRRPIQVLCYPDRFVIEDGNNSNHNAITVSIDRSVDDSLEHFVHSIWSVIEHWGIAGPGGYWKPVLRINLKAGGEANYRRLAKLLSNSGLEMETSN